MRSWHRNLLSVSVLNSLPSPGNRQMTNGSPLRESKTYSAPTGSFRQVASNECGRLDRANSTLPVYFSTFSPCRSCGGRHRLDRRFLRRTHGRSRYRFLVSSVIQSKTPFGAGSLGSLQLARNLCGGFFLPGKRLQFANLARGPSPPWSRPVRATPLFPPFVDFLGT